MQSMVPGIKIVFLLYVLQFILIIGNVETHSGSGTYNSDPLMNITIDNGQIYFHVQYYGSILGWKLLFVIFQNVNFILGNSNFNLGNVARDLCIFMKEVGWNPDRVVTNANSIWNSIKRSEDALLYTNCIRNIIWGHKKIVLSKIVPEEILKIKYCLVEGIKKKRESYICLWKTSMISIRATEVNYIKTNTSLWVSSQKIKDLLNMSLWNNLEKKILFR
jgi:hypothetical protein